MSENEYDDDTVSDDESIIDDESDEGLMIDDESDNGEESDTDDESDSETSINDKESFLPLSDDIEFNATSWYAEDIDIQVQDDVISQYVIYIFGRMENGKSITVEVNNYKPLFHIRVPDDWSRDDCTKALLHFKSLCPKYRDEVAKIDISKHHDLHENFCAGKKFKFMSFHFNTKKACDEFTKIFRNRIKVPRVMKTYEIFDTYEKKVDPIISFGHRQNLQTEGWNVIKGNGFTNKSIKDVTTNHYVETDYTNVVEYKGDLKPLPPLLITSYDIECISGDGTFPQADRPEDKIVSICATTNVYGSEKIVRTDVLALDTSKRIKNSNMKCFDNQTDLILAWRDTINDIDPDFIIGFNTFGFDNKYVYEKAEQPGVNCAKRFSYISRLRKHKCIFKKETISSAGLGDNEMWLHHIPGREQCDIMKLVMQDFKITSYSLSFCSEEFMKRKVTTELFGKKQTGLKYKIFCDTKEVEVDNYVKFEVNQFMVEEKVKILEVHDNYIITDANVALTPSCKMCLAKDDMGPQELFDSFPKGPDERKRIHQYCVQDCALVNKLCHRLDFITQRMALASVSNVPFSYIILKGQGIKALSLFAKICKKHKYLIKDMKPSKEMSSMGGKIGYEGAIVFDPIKGFYERPLCTLDFNSLYPSIEIAFDMSHETYVTNEKYMDLPDYHYRTITYWNILTKELSLDIIDNYMSIFAKCKREEDNKFGNIEFVEEYIEEKEDIVNIQHYTFKETINGKVRLRQISLDQIDKKKKFLKEEANTTFATLKTNIDEKTPTMSQLPEKSGIVGTILQWLLSARKIAKKNMKKFPDKRQIYDGQQKALKITANSIYGQLGSGVSPVGCVPIAAATTAGGRMMLTRAKDHMEQEFKPITKKLYNAFKNNKMDVVNKILDKELEDRHNEEFIENMKKTLIELYDSYDIYPIVAYGDTDSNFNDFKITDKETKSMPTNRWCRDMCMRLGEIAEKLVKIRLPWPNNMAYEKVIQPVALMAKKNYLGYKYEDKLDEYDFMIMGFKLKRRDGSIVFQKVVGKAISKALDEIDPHGALEFLGQALQDIIDGVYTIYDFTTSRLLKAKYKGTKITDDEGYDESTRSESVEFINTQIKEITKNDKSIKTGDAKFKERVEQIFTEYDGDNYRKKLFATGTIGEWHWYDVDGAPAHVQLCQRMRKRDPGNCPQMNSRIPYVYIVKENSKNMLQGDLIEHPDYILENDLKIDYLFYITNQIQNPATQFFELITDDIHDMFSNIITKENKKNETIFYKKNVVENKKMYQNYGFDLNSDSDEEDNTMELINRCKNIHEKKVKKKSTKRTNITKDNKSMAEVIIKNSISITKFI